MRSAERPSVAAAGGGVWFLILAGLLALASGVGWGYLTFRIDAGDRAFDEGRRALAEEEPALVDGTAELAAGQQDLDEGRQAYTEAESKWHLVWADRLFRGGRGFRQAKKRIAEGEQRLAAGESKLGVGQDRIEAGRLKLQTGRERLAFARRARWVCAVGALFFAAVSVALGLRRRRTAP